MNPVLSRSSVLQHFKLGDVLNINNKIIFYQELEHLTYIVNVVMYINYYTILPPAMEISIRLEGIEAPALLTALTVTVRYRLQMSTLSSSVQNTVMFMVVFRASGLYIGEKMVAFSPAEVSRSTRKYVGSLMLSGRLTWSGRLILVTCRDRKKSHTRFVNCRGVSISHDNWKIYSQYKLEYTYTVYLCVNSRPLQLLPLLQTLAAVNTSLVEFKILTV